MVPTRKQFLSLKKQFPGMILMFRVNEYAEAFYDDADEVAKALDLTAFRFYPFPGKPVKFVGFPLVDKFDQARKLVIAGYKVMMIEDLSEY